MPADIFIGLGSNLGNRAANLAKGLELLREAGAIITAVSGYYETEPRECPPQPNFLNAVACISWEKTAAECLQFLLEAEQMAGRIRHLPAEPRVLDMDLLFYGSLIITTNELILPHPRLHLRRFVLVPLWEIAPDFCHPVFRKTITTLLNECPDTGKVNKATLLEPHYSGAMMRRVDSVKRRRD